MNIAEVSEPLEPEEYQRPPTDIHTWFSLTYSNYLVLHRSILQSTPLDFQHRFTELMDELRGMLGEGLRDKMASNYEVRVMARDTEWITPYEECPECEGAGESRPRWWRRHVLCYLCGGEGEVEEDHRRETAEEVGFIDDPIPHYNRGRTTLDLDSGEELRYCSGCKGHHTWSGGCPPTDAPTETA